MMKPRALLSGAEVDALYSVIDKKLDGIGMETQPQVAAKILKLVADPQAGLRQYADVIKSDPVISGRLLRLANSAFFAQRQPVTALERACVLLGVERLKAVSLGFYLSRAATTDPTQTLSRRVWGEGVYRACLAAEVARETCPGSAPEAFVIGLMLDVGVPIAAKLLGPSYVQLLEEQKTPTRQFKEEFQSLPFTHVDVAAALMRRWKLPELLARPIELHHTAPAEDPRADSLNKLHRVAYYVGALQLEPTSKPREAAPMPLTAERVLGLRPERLEGLITRSSAEYGAMSELFRDTADSIGSPEQMADAVQRQLIDIIDQTMAKQIAQETSGGPERFAIGERHIEIEVSAPGLAMAYLSDASGKRLVSHAFKPGRESIDAVFDALGLDEAGKAEAEPLVEYLRSLAA